jgi:3-oxoacyl-[acyl-carrier-protein] synthase II
MQPRPNRRAVITGIGAVTPLGIGALALWEGLQAGRSAVQRLTGEHITAFPSQIGAPVDGFDARLYLDKKERKRLSVMSRPFQFAVAAARLARDDAGLGTEQIDPTRLATVLGAGTIPNDLNDFIRGGRLATVGVGHVDLQRWGLEGMSLVPPMFMLGYIPNMMGCHVSVLNDAQGPSNTIVATDAAGLLALGEAWRYVANDRADAVLVGSADARLSIIGTIRQHLMTPLSKRNQAPERACRPFDRERDGVVLGEGGAVFVMEELEHARRRGATIYAELVGFGSSFDKSVDRRFGRWRDGAPRDRREPYARRGGEHGLTRAIRLALDQAGLVPVDLDHVNAHGLSTIPDDIWEAEGVAAALGGADVPVFAPKSYLGQLSAGSSPVELAASLLALRHGVLPASLNHEQPDPRCPIKVSTQPRPVKKPHFLKVAFTELGHGVALVCRQP